MRHNSEKTPKVRLRVINKELTRKKNVYDSTRSDEWGNIVVPEHDPEPFPELFQQESKKSQKKAKNDAVESWGVNSALTGIKMSICVSILVSVTAT